MYCFQRNHCSGSMILLRQTVIRDALFLSIVLILCSGGPFSDNKGMGLLRDGPLLQADILIRINIFMNLLRHYKNVVWFHGHTHQPPKYQVECSTVNYNKRFGFHSMHIPALASERRNECFRLCKGP